MNYTVSLLKTREDCETLLTIALADKGTLMYRKEGMQRLSQSATLTSAEILAELTSLNAEISALQTIINTVPDGPVKDDTIVRLKKADYKKSLLEGKKGKYGVISLLEREFDIACTDQAITEADAYIAAVTAHMNTL